MVDKEKSGLEKWASTPSTRGENVDSNLYRTFLGKYTMPFGMKEEDYLAGLLKGLSLITKLKIENALKSCFDDGVRVGMVLPKNEEPLA